jgi:sugar phosphate permease
MYDPNQNRALMVLLGGLGSAAGVVLYLKGYKTEVTAAAVSVTVVGAFIGAARVLAGEEHISATPILPAG